MKKTTLLLVLFSAVLFSGCSLLPKTTVNSPSVPNPTTQPLVGSDKDTHGCIPSAGYSWCESKQKCYRPWEESCENITPSTSVTPTVDETSIIKSSIKQALILKHGDSAKEFTISVSKIDGNSASGGITASGGGAMWFAAKVNDTWKLVWDGNGIILCTDLTTYPNFSKTILPECYDLKTDKLEKR